MRRPGRHGRAASGAGKANSPTPGEAPAGIKRTGNSIFNRIWTLLGVPCVTVPAYKGRNGLPIGVQIVGPYGADTQTLYWAEWVRRALA